MSIKLPRLQLGVPLINLTTGAPTATFVLWWDQVAKALETQEATQDGVLDELAEQLALILETQDTAEAALETAEEAETKADEALAGGGEMSAATSLQLSQPLNITITSTDIGGSAGADIDISPHVRRYGNGDQVSVAGLYVSPDPYDITTFIFYDDPTRLDTTPTYQFTSVEADAYSSPTYPNRHYVGALTTPSDGGLPTTGIPGTRS